MIQSFPETLMEVKDSCMTHPWTLLRPHDIMFLHLTGLTRDKHVRARQKLPVSWAASRRSFIRLRCWRLSSYGLTSESFWLVGWEASPCYTHTHTHHGDAKPVGGEEGLFLESRGGRALVVGGLGSWQQFRCLLIMCQLLRWTRVRTHRSPSPRFLTVARQRSCWACVCDSGGNPAVHNRRGVLVLAQRVTNPTKVLWKCRFKRRTVRRRLLGGPVSLWLRRPINAQTCHEFICIPNPWGDPRPPRGDGGLRAGHKHTLTRNLALSPPSPACQPTLLWLTVRRPCESCGSV